MARRTIYTPNSERICELAEERCLPNGELRRAARLSATALSRALNGRPILQKTAFMLARALNASLNDVVIR